MNKLWHVCAVLFLTALFLCSSFAHSQEKVDLLITHGTVVTMDGKRTIVDDGAIAIKGDSIAAVGSSDEIAPRYSAAQTIDAKNTLVLPGFVNGHTHVPIKLLLVLHDDVTLK